MTDIIVVDMDEYYVEQVYAIYTANFTEKWSEKSLRKEIVNELARTLVAVKDDEVLGFLNLRHVYSDGDINNIAVKEEYRRSHIGSLLMKRMFAIAKKERITSYTLEVRVSNTAAAKFYESFGFKPVGQRRDYYANPIEDAILYKIELEPDVPKSDLPEPDNL